MDLSIEHKIKFKILLKSEKIKEIMAKSRSQTSQDSAMISPDHTLSMYYDNYGFNSSLPSITLQLQPPQGHDPTPSEYNMNGEDPHQSAANLLSWRKLHLSRAKLKAINKTSALMSGFAMVAMVEMQINSDTKVPPGLLIAFVVCTSLLVAVHMLALMISTCILPNVEAISNLHNAKIVEESPHERMHWYIEAGWAFSTVLGIFLFLCELAILCWVKFYDESVWAAASATVIMVPVLILFIGFAIHFYHKLVVHKYELTESGLRELEHLRIQLDNTLQPSPQPQMSMGRNVNIV